MLKKFMNKKNIAVIVVVCIVVILLLLTFQTTVVAGLSVCIAEDVSPKEYVEVGLMPEGYNFSSYKDMLVHEIRVDKAARCREERKEFVGTSLQNLSEQIKNSYTYIDVIASEEENLEKYHTYMKNLELESTTDIEKDSLYHLMDAIANSAHLYMSLDVYYPGYTLEQTKMQAEALYAGLSESSATEQIVIEPIISNEYDPVPEIGLAERYAEDILQLQTEDGNGKFDYIVQFTMTYCDSASNNILEEKVIAVVGEKAYRIVDVQVELAEEYHLIAVDGNVRPYVSGTNMTCSTVEPVVLEMDGMKAKADEFVQLFQKIMMVYFSDQEALDELYEVYFVTDVESQETEVAETEAADTEIDYDSLKFAQIEKELLAEIEGAYSYEKEWGTILTLEAFSNAMRDNASVVLAKRLLDEGKNEMWGRVLTDTEMQEIHTNAGILEKFYTNSQDAVLVASQPMIAENTGTESGESELANIEFDVMQSLFETSYTVWCGEDVPESVYGGYFQYTVGEICEIELTVLNTEQEIYITGIGIHWNDEQQMFHNQVVSTYVLPNTILMQKQAEAAINRDEYETEEDYNYAIAEWLYENYPEYCQNPASVSNSSTSGFSIYGNQSKVSNIFNNIEELGNDAWGYVTDVWDSVGFVIEYGFEGTPIAYFLTDNGKYQSFQDDFKLFVWKATDVYNTVRDEVVDWWNDLWN